MMERIFLRRYAVASISIATMIFNGSAFASDTDVILDQDGNPGCNQIIANASVVEIRDTNPPLNDTKTITDGFVTIRYTTHTPESGPTTVTLWEILDPNSGANPPNDPPLPIYPIISTIHKADGNAGARVFHFGLAGAKRDLDEEGASTLKALAFCYSMEMPSEDVEEIPRCEDLDNFELEGVAITCPKDDANNTLQRDVVVRNKSTLGKPSTLCTCGYTATECDEAATVGTADACPTGDPLNSTPTVILFWDDQGPSGDDGGCGLILGRWTCWR